MNKNDLYEEKYTIYRDKDGVVRKVKREKEVKHSFFGISFLKFGVVISVFFAIIHFSGIIPTAQSPEEEKKDKPVQVQTASKPNYEASEEGLHEESYYNYYSDDGIMFPYSSSRYITEEDINHCMAVENEPLCDIVQKGINEIYARNGYDFKKQGWKDYYNKYSWYISKGYDDAEARECFNVFEEKNMNLLETIREEMKESYSNN